MSAQSSALFLGYGRAGHGVTRSFPGPIPMEELRSELFGWDVSQHPMTVDVGGQSVAVPNRLAIVREDTSRVLGVASERYAVHQYRDSLLSGLSRIIGGSLAVDAAGFTAHGARAWVSVSLPDTVTTAEGIEFLPRIMAYGSHDSSLPTGYKRSALLMVCNNMLSIMLRDKSASRHGFGEVKVRHTANSALRLESAQQALGILANVEDEFSAQVRELCEQEVTRKQWAAFLDAYVPITDETAGRSLTMAENKRDALNAMYLSDDRCAPWAGTSFGVVQAVNTFDHHMSIVRGATRAERNMERALTDHFDRLDAGTLTTLNRVLATV